MRQGRTETPAPIIIEVEGGLVQDVYTAGEPPPRVIVVDRDGDGLEEDDPRVKADPNGHLCFVTNWEGHEQALSTKERRERYAHWMREMVEDED